MNKGKIIDIQKEYLIVLNDQMAYTKIKKKDGLSVGKEIYYFEEDLYKESKQPVKKYFLIAAVLFMMLFIQPLLVAEEVYGYISVDINPSIELEVNRTLEVLSVEAMNDDAKSIIRDEWIGKPAKEVIDLIIEETQSKGILNKERNFVLVSYYFNDQDLKSDEIFVQSLDELFNEKSHDYEVAVIKSDAETHSEAKEAKESLGKQVVNKKMNTKVEDLLSAKESIEQDEDFKIYKNNNDLGDNDHESSNRKDLDDNHNKKDEKNPIFGNRDDVPGLNKQNNDHDNNEENDDKRDSDDNREDNREDNNQTKKMITPPDARAIALDLVNGRIIEVHLDRDNSEAEYEIKIILEEAVHEIIIDGFTGEIISHEHEVDGINDDFDNEENNKNNNTNQEDDASQDKNVDEDDDDDDNDNEVDGNRNENNENSYIQRQTIEAIAFEILGGKGKVLKVDLDHDDNEAEYTLEIQFNDEIHKMKINALTGDLIEHEIEDIEEDIEEDTEYDNDSKNYEENKEEVRDRISRKEAKNKAFEAIGGQGKITNFDFDKDDDKVEYSFEIDFKGKIYEVEINGFTGEVVE